MVVSIRFKGRELFYTICKCISISSHELILQWLNYKVLGQPLNYLLKA